MKVLLLEVSLVNCILGISKDIKWKVRVGLVQVSLVNFILGISREIKIEGEDDVTRNIIDELHSRDIQGVQTAGESVLL